MASCGNRCSGRKQILPAGADRRRRKYLELCQCRSIWRTDRSSRGAAAFLMKNFGAAGLTGASRSHSSIYLTRDGGVSFEMTELPFAQVTELPETAEEYGLSMEDYDYLSMPKQEGEKLLIRVTSEEAETDGFMFQSEDQGVTWEYQGVFQSKKQAEFYHPSLLILASFINPGIWYRIRRSVMPCSLIKLLIFPLKYRRSTIWVSPKWRAAKGAKLWA